MRSCPLKGERIISHTQILPGGEPSPFHAASVPSGRSSRTVKLMAVHVVHVDQARIGHTLSSKVSHHTSEIQPAAHGTFAVMSQLVHNLLFLCTLIWAGPRPVDPGRARGSEPYLQSRKPVTEVTCCCWGFEDKSAEM